MRKKIGLILAGVAAVGALSVAPTAVNAAVPSTAPTASAWAGPPPGTNPCGYPGIPAYDRYGRLMYCWYR